jgi:hypothetical protein
MLFMPEERCAGPTEVRAEGSTKAGMLAAELLQVQQPGLDDTTSECYSPPLMQT